MDTIHERIYDALRDAGCRPQGRPGRFQALCPAHDDRNPSLSVSTGSDGRVLIHCHAGCDTDGVLSAIGMSAADLFDPETKPPTRRRDPDPWLPCHRNHDPAVHRQTAEYRYHNLDGTLAFAVTRCAEKCFAQWRPDPTSKSGRRWGITDKTTGARVVPYLPYRLPQLLASQRVVFPPCVWVVEGEKDAERLWSLGIPGTCNSGGGGKWTAEHARWLRGMDVVVVLDRDAPGKAHAEQVVATLLGVARSIEVLYPEHGKDLSDHLDAGGTIATLNLLDTPLPAPEETPA